MLLREITLRLSLASMLASCGRAEVADTTIRPAPLQPEPLECARPVAIAEIGWLVFFDHSHGFTLSERGGLIVRELASVFQARHGRIMVVNGNVNEAESSSADHGLGMRRAQAVAKALEEAGIPSAAIYVKDLGATSPLIPGSIGAPEVQNRRVDLVPLGGWNNDHKVARACKAFIRTSCFGAIDRQQHAACEDALSKLERD